MNSTPKASRTAQWAVILCDSFFHEFICCIATHTQKNDFLPLYERILHLTHAPEHNLQFQKQKNREIGIIRCMNPIKVEFALFRLFLILL